MIFQFSYGVLSSCMMMTLLHDDDIHGHSTSGYVTVDVGMSDLPVYVPEGSLLPAWPPGRRTTAARDRPLMWIAWVGNASVGEGVYHEDDGLTLDHLTGNYVIITASLTTSAHAVTVAISTASGGYDGAPIHRMHGAQLRGAVTANVRGVSCVVGNVTTPLVRVATGEYEKAGWWVSSGVSAEMICPEGSVVAMCPLSKATDSVRILFSLG